LSLATQTEDEEILKIKGKNHKLVLYTLLVHSKRYAKKMVYSLWFIVKW